MSESTSNSGANTKGKKAKQSALAGGQHKPNGYKTKPRSQQNNLKRNTNADQGLNWRRNEKTEDVSDEDEDDDNSCIVCANTIEIASLSPCNHRVCHKCSLRQRALYNKKQCLICRTECEKLIFTEDLQALDYYAISADKIAATDEKYSIDFTSDESKTTTLKLLKFICPVKNCKEEEFSNFKQLNEHCKVKHDKSYCLLCFQVKKAFISELKLYTGLQLQTHQSKGDETGFKGHPICKYCSKRRHFYSDDELFVHMRESHEKCHICDQIDSRNPQYFKNYDALFSHFKNDHYVCNVQSCLDQKFIVFRNDLDLQAHMIQEHGDLFGGSRTLMSYSFGGQLSTFNDSARTLDDPDTEHKDTLAVKRMRLEERARHYLNYSQSEFSKFQAINVAYQAGDIDASTVKQEYEDIFKDVHADITVLLYELSEICPKGSKKQKDLLEITNHDSYKQMFEEKFPSLPGSNTSSSLSISGWNNSTTSGNSINTKKFPVLSSSAASSSTSSSRGNSINYASPSSKPAHTGPRVTSFPALPGEQSSVRVVPGSQIKTTSKSNKKVPNYSSLAYSSISATNSTPSSTSSSSTSLQKQDYSNVALPKYLDNIQKKENKPANEEAPKPHIENPAFPSLPSTPAKKKIPRVKPVNVSMGVWGSSASASSSSVATSSSFPTLGGLNDTSTLNEALPVVVQPKGGKKKKGKQLLFHIGM